MLFFARGLNVLSELIQSSFLLPGMGCTQAKGKAMLGPLTLPTPTREVFENAHSHEAHPARQQDAMSAEKGVPVMQNVGMRGRVCRDREHVLAFLRDKRNVGSLPADASRYAALHVLLPCFSAGDGRGGPSQRLTSVKRTGQAPFKKSPFRAEGLDFRPGRFWKFGEPILAYSDRLRSFWTSNIDSG